jgi:hypothetical protein
MHQLPSTPPPWEKEAETNKRVEVAAAAEEKRRGGTGRRGEGKGALAAREGGNGRRRIGDELWL